MEWATLPPRASDWLLLTLLGSLVFLALARYFQAQRFGVFLSMPWHSKGQDLAQSYNPTRIAFQHDFFAGLSATLTAVAAIYWLNISTFHAGVAVTVHAPLRYVQVALGTILFVLLKNLISAFVAFIFDSQNAVIAAQNQFFAYFSWVSLVVWPVLFTSLYLPQQGRLLYYLLYGILILGFIYATIRSLPVIFRVSGLMVHKVLYLCTLEIVPILLFVKWLNSL